MTVSATTRRALAAVLAAGTLTVAAAVPASADDRRGDHRRDHRGSQSLVISDVRHDAGGRGDRSNRALNGEWVEIRNNGRHGVDLSGFTLSDSDGNRYRFSGFRLDGRSSVRVHTGQGRNTQRDVYQNRRQQIWDRNDTATLRDRRGNLVDSDSWGNRDNRGRRDGGR
ncbi:lamin tail domain-containing protein [Streptomyces sp. NPDC090085]|uniref:lamin tail domain-containing protein n=1 Tax=unclassified Streptomyces TaxID=2593676 RepID=UPI0034413E4E